MDIFGIGVRIQNSVHEHARLARGTGRSHVLSDLVEDRDVVVFSRQELAREFRKLQTERRRTQLYTAVIIDPAKFAEEGDRRMRELTYATTRRLFFDHVWLEEYYALKMSSAMRDLVGFSKKYGRDQI